MPKKLKKPKKKRSPKPLETYITGALRKVWYYSKLRRDAYNQAKVGTKYRCYVCEQLVDKVQIDHINPVGSPKQDDNTLDWGKYVNKLLYCDPSNVAAICLACHKSKSAVEAHLRKIKRQDKKKKLD